MLFWSEGFSTDHSLLLRAPPFVRGKQHLYELFRPEHAPVPDAAPRSARPAGRAALPPLARAIRLVVRCSGLLNYCWNTEIPKSHTIKEAVSHDPSYRKLLSRL